MAAAEGTSWGCAATTPREDPATGVEPKNFLPHPDDVDDGARARGDPSPRVALTMRRTAVDDMVVVMRRVQLMMSFDAVVISTPHHGRRRTQVMCEHVRKPHEPVLLFLKTQRLVQLQDSGDGLRVSAYNVVQQYKK